MRERIAKHHADWRGRRVRSRTAQFTRSRTHDGYPISVALSGRTETLRWIAVVEQYNAHRTPRCRPDPCLQNLDRNTRFWMIHSPFRSLHILDITLTSLLTGENLTVGEVGDLGRHLAWIPLQRLTLGTQVVDPLFNGVVQWPRLPGIMEVELHFLRGGPPNEWKRPFFPHSLRAFTSLRTLVLQVERLGASRSPLAKPHPLFASYKKSVPYIPRPTGETPTATLRRVAENVSHVCTSLEQISWSERRREGTGWHTEALAYRRNSLTRVWE